MSSWRLNGRWQDQTFGFFEQRLDPVGSGVTFVLGDVAPEVVEDDLDVIDPGGLDLRESFDRGCFQYAEGDADRIFGL